jgi:hypothetical protein
MKFIISIYNSNSWLLILVVLYVLFSHIVPMTYAQTIQNNKNINTPLTAAANNIFNNFEKGIFNIAKQLEYTVDIDADQVFPNNTIKYTILNRYEPSEYRLLVLKYSMLGFDISATDIRIKTESNKIDQNNTRIDFPFMVAKNVKVSNGLINLSYHDVNMSSIYAIYDTHTDIFSVHIPIAVASRYLPNAYFSSSFCMVEQTDFIV